MRVPASLTLPRISMKSVARGPGSIIPELSTTAHVQRLTATTVALHRACIAEWYHLTLGPCHSAAVASYPSSVPYRGCIAET
eukprot:2435672-Rhodomonas_salina.1